MAGESALQPVNPGDEPFFDEAAGPLVRPYAMVRGRARPNTYGLEPVTLVVALVPVRAKTGLPPELERLLRLCQRPISVAEAASRLDLPVLVVRGLLNELIARREVIFRPADSLRVPAVS
ncbi:DUF742 domain-containing protein [Amycolatopsis nigrescens]|uniref:DUF742 domain-containing protein n=1 Tax=Amycolatopsis nigrescens TaxID=381445 RepID=UPI0003A00D01|nr:DUF742 domain-containing protein [Amycolatopsis nigrescens]